jgi:hypothetical protein
MMALNLRYIQLLNVGFKKKKLERCTSLEFKTPQFFNWKKCVKVCLIFEVIQYNGERIKLYDILRRKITEKLARLRPIHEDIIKTDLKTTCDNLCLWG